ncbi:hypothetical protein ACQUQP_18425 [Marinobacterium sp. YM272]|uniref:hypothetical protein n=1 Tax=Marinobacterium sp. YM272 TaxID=3421654 RepID=UPI003D7F1C3B
MHLLAGLALLGAGLPAFTYLVCVAGLAISLYTLLYPWRKSGEAALVKGLSWYPDKKRLVFVMADGSQLDVEKTLSLAAVPGLISISAITERRVLPVWLVVTRDQLDEPDWRRLKILVEWSGFPQREASGQG